MKMRELIEGQIQLAEGSPSEYPGGSRTKDLVRRLDSIQKRYSDLLDDMFRAYSDIASMIGDEPSMPRPGDGRDEKNLRMAVKNVDGIVSVRALSALGDLSKTTNTYLRNLR